MYNCLQRSHATKLDRTHSLKKVIAKFFRVQCAALFYIENDAEIFPAHYTWKVAGKGLMMNKLAMINFCEINLEK